MKKYILALLILSMSMLNAYSQINKDVEGCKDHPLFPRLDSYIIAECSTVDSMLAFINDSAEYIAVYGDMTTIVYSKNRMGGDTLTNIQIMKYYAKIILRMGGRVVFANENFASFEFVYMDKAYKFMLTEFYQGLVFKMQVIEIAEKK